MAKEQVSSILRALEILECFMDNETEWTLKRLVAQLDLPTTTVHRQLSTLTDRGYLVQDPVRKSYRVGPRLLLLSSTVLSHSDLRSTARPELEKLSATVKETINLSVMLDREIFYLDKVETFRSVVCNTKVGTRAPAHATSGGKIMLAFHDPDYVDAYCRDLPQMQRLTDRTVFSPDLLREQLAQARINGFAIDDGEIEPGLICVGAPIFGLDQTVVAGIGNIYADEILFDARIRPSRPAASLTAAEWARLAEAIPRLMGAGVENRRMAPQDYQATRGGEYHDTAAKVYGRAGRPCPRCGAALQLIRLAGRSSCFCPCCQPGQAGRQTAPGR